MKKTMAMVTVLLMGTGFLGTTLTAQRGGQGPRGGGRGMNIPSERMLSRILDLTDEQNEKVNSLREAARASVSSSERGEAREAETVESCPGHGHLRSPAGGRTGSCQPRWQGKDEGPIRIQ